MILGPLLVLALGLPAPASVHDGATPPSATSGWCSPPALRETLVASLRELASGEGAEAVARRRMYGLNAVPADSVVAVTDEAVCERAAREYYRHRLGPMPAGGVSVVRVGERYAVEGAERAGEWIIVTIFSARFEPIAYIAQ